MAKRKALWVTTVPREAREAVGLELLDALDDQVTWAQLRLRQAVYLGRLEGLTWDEVATAIGCSKSTAFARYADADPEAEGWAPWSSVVQEGV